MTTDPEVKTEPVALNFGSEEGKQENGSGQTTASDSQDRMDTSVNGEESNTADSSSVRNGSATASVGSGDSDDRNPESQESSSNTSTATTDTNESATNSNDQVSSSGYKYYIVAGSFKNEQNAMDYKDKLSDENFPAMVIRKPDSDFFFVAYNQFGNLDQAKVALGDIVEYQNENAWIYRGN